MSLSIRFIAHVEAGTSRPARRQRLHDVGVGIVFEFRPLDIGISVLKVAEAASTELKVEENEGSQNQDTTRDRNTNDETGACTTATRAGFVDR